MGLTHTPEVNQKALLDLIMLERKQPETSCKAQMRISMETENARFGSYESLFWGEGLKPHSAPVDEKSQPLSQLTSKVPIHCQEGFGKLIGFIPHVQAQNKYILTPRPLILK